MYFVQTAFLGALGALAIPLIVHLMFRMRTRRVDLGTIRFLKEVLQKNARRKRIKRLILLAMRMACVALLAVLFARPYFLAETVRNREKFVAILIDRSASMRQQLDGQTLLDRAIGEARQVIETSDKDVQRQRQERFMRAAADPALSKEFLMRTSMIDTVRESYEIQ